MNISARADRLLQPVLPPLHDALSALGVSDDWSVDVADGDAPYRIDGRTILLSAALEGADGHPLDAGNPRGLDRWRRAMASVLEGAVLVGLPPGGPAWLRVGLAIYLADRAAPVLSVGHAALSALGAGDLHTYPRSGFAVLRAWDALGEDAEGKARQAIAENKVAVRDWVDAGRWICGAGWSVLCADQVRAHPVDVPVQLGPWSWARLAVDAHPRGAHVRVRGAGGVVPAWAKGGEAYQGFAAACAEGARIEPEPGGPLGDWSMVSAVGFGTAFGARGLVFSFHGGGRVEMVLADAFVGSQADVAQAEKVGTSGVVRGRWRVVGPHAFEMLDLSPMGVTVHGRNAAPFVMPAEGMGLPAQLQAMQDTPWRWTREGNSLELTGQMFGGNVTMRLTAS